MSPRTRSTTGAEALARWVNLVAHAEHAVEHPMRSTERLEVACAWAKRATLPAGDCTRENPFIQLLDVARAFALETAAGRVARVGDLLAALDAAAALRPLHTAPGAVNVVEAPSSAPPPSLPFRRDIDG